MSNEHKRPRRERPWGDIPRGTFPGDGLVVVDKDKGVTSHDIVGAIRRLAGTKKVGHAGTLDPMATGVLCVGIGRVTKLLQYITGSAKEYEATIRLGIGTSTEDAEGEVTDSPGVSRICDELLARTMRELNGEILQVPSAVSAIKVQGKRAYQLVREGKDVQLEARRVLIEEFALLGKQRAENQDGIPVVDIDVRVRCSAGTYIRALARDLGAALGTTAHLTSLRRTRVGRWDEDQARTIRALADCEALFSLASSDSFVSLAQVCRALFAGVDVSKEEAEDLAMGRFIEQRPTFTDSAPALASVQEEAKVRVAWSENTPVALVSKRSGKLKPDLLLTSFINQNLK